MMFQTYGDRRNPAVLFFHATGVTGAKGFAEMLVHIAERDCMPELPFIRK